VPEVQPEQIIGGDGGVPMNNGEYTEAGLDPFFSSLNFDCDLRDFQISQD